MLISLTIVQKSIAKHFHAPPLIVVWIICVVFDNWSEENLDLKTSWQIGHWMEWNENKWIDFVYVRNWGNEDRAIYRVLYTWSNRKQTFLFWWFCIFKQMNDKILPFCLAKHIKIVNYKNNCLCAGVFHKIIHYIFFPSSRHCFGICLHLTFSFCFHCVCDNK